MDVVADLMATVFLEKPAKGNCSQRLSTTLATADDHAAPGRHTEPRDKSHYNPANDLGVSQ